ncbi:MAG: DUF4365 domain-containing protein [Actinophytocola sp.]|uniref:DUF4365 domain-containing protein n=1 Tax=Actinophytocola sp. TaxID=1872138 RepID=UPI001325B33C|nr:DUF4365 domain-containing protein [Actinophytocola sp.]MPZ82951.1 DUF4365 domain-containing protein [Actinophytocola sp.]
MLDAHNHQGKFGQDYIRALASAAGLLVFTYDLDRVGIDLGFRYPGRAGGFSSPAIEVQVKSWSRPRPVSGEWHFDGLNEQQFNWLAGPDYTVPRYLFLVSVPREREEYALFEPGGMTLRHLAYFLSLEDEDLVEEPNPARRRNVRVPLGNVLTIKSLLRLLDSTLVGAG